MAKMNPSDLLKAILIAKDSNEAIEQIIAKDKGQGRGNWGHKGRPGQRGGSSKQGQGGGQSYSSVRESTPHYKVDDVTAKKKSDSVRSNLNVKGMQNKLDGVKNIMNGPRLLQHGDQLTLKGKGMEMRITRKDDMDGWFEADIWGDGKHKRSVPIQPDDLDSLSERVFNANGASDIDAQYTQYGRNTEKITEKTTAGKGLKPSDDPELAKIRTRLVPNKYGAANGQINQAAQDYVSDMMDKFSRELIGGEKFENCKQAYAVAQKQMQKLMKTLSDDWNDDDTLGPAWIVANGQEYSKAMKDWQKMDRDQKGRVIDEATSNPQKGFKALTDTYDYEYDAMNDFDTSDPDYKSAVREEEEEEYRPQNSSRRNQGYGAYYNPYEQRWETPE